MVDLIEKSLKVAAIKFKWQKDEKTYDYFIPHGLELSPGDKVVVETKRGETEVVVAEIKEKSDRAERSIIRRVEEKPAPETSADWNF